jgi:hypothetical protein
MSAAGACGPTVEVVMRARELGGMSDTAYLLPDPSFARFFSRAFRGAAFSVPFLAGQKGDMPTGPTGRTAA